MRLLTTDYTDPWLLSFMGFSTFSAPSTPTTGSFVEKAGLKVQKMLSGPRGGDAQIAARIAEGKTNMVFFFRDPLDKHPHEPDIAMLMRLCDVWNVPLATNPATASLLIDHLH